jgi:hypothetical protein
MLMSSSEMLGTARNIQNARRNECAWNICMDYTSLAYFCQLWPRNKLIFYSKLVKDRKEISSDPFYIVIEIM